MHKKYHEKFKILDILAVTTQAHEGIETSSLKQSLLCIGVTTQAHEGIEIVGHPVPVPGKKTYFYIFTEKVHQYDA